MAALSREQHPIVAAYFTDRRARRQDAAQAAADHPAQADAVHG
jgi:hypothetical protein